MRVLLLANDAGDGNVVGWQDNLKREGVPFDVISGTTPLTAATFAEADRAAALCALGVTSLGATTHGRSASASSAAR
jgi:6,7-dimethyl-8-ribityllumazine synthase